MITGGVNLSKEQFANIDSSTYIWQSKFEYYGKQIINQDEQEKYKFISIRKYNKYEVLPVISPSGLFFRVNYGNIINLAKLKKEDQQIFFKRIKF
tara:strand:+ start:276 stop:560 length:285 start_codon:yes stop_codon:yes gene_type:complete